MDLSRRTRRRAWGLCAGAVLLLTGAALVAPPAHERGASVDCAPAKEAAKEAEDADQPKDADAKPQEDPDAEAGSGDSEAEPERESGACGVRAEGILDQERTAAYNRSRLSAEDSTAYALAAQRRPLAMLAPQTVTGNGGTWAEYGHGPMIGNDPKYPTTQGDGFGDIEGRINDFAYNQTTGAVYAAVAQGGLWTSTDLGGHWSPIGDTLPIQSTGSVAWTPANGGEIIVATGDMAFSNDYGGVGTFWSSDEGQTWTKSTGAPDGALAFRVAVDPTNPSVVYDATGKGLYRSNDAGHSFENVNLPTGDCAGDSDQPGCFFANMVTDVAVQATDSLGHTGGAVVAAVGWRGGQQLNFAGHPEAPANGLYRSATGAINSFTKVPDSAGFTPTDHAARVAFGTTTGPGQDSRYLYAVSQDAVLFQEQAGGENDIPLVGTPSVLDAIYVSGDFGQSWRVMETRNEFILDPANLSSLSQLTALGIGPGYQTTYNEYIKPDPTRHDLQGVPTRVVLGMEEVWQNLLPTAQSGHSQFVVFGSYTASGGACLVVPEQCGTAQQIATHTTTHPDQHAILMVPDEQGGVTLLVGNDGGAYKQHSTATGLFTQLGWANGANLGFETLLPYGAAMAKDGTVYAGLQDNGQLKILPNGEQHTVYVGDGTFAAVDPDHSNIAYDELPAAGLNVTTDGGSTWTAMDPGLLDADFVAPFLMDPHDANHLLVAGRNIAETTKGPDTGTWAHVFDLGTHEHPGDASAVATDDDAPNVAIAAALDGDNAYVGFCGDCDPVKLNREFHTGFATNVGGTQPPQRKTSAGWHIATAAGLPNRIITSVAIDPTDPKTVYVTVGSSAARYFAPLGSQEEDTSDAGAGHLFKSTDAGESFQDISGDLPAAQATWVLPRGPQLIVGTAIGTYIAAGNDGGHFEVLGTGIPPVAIYQLSFKPGDDTTIVAATFGRGVWTYKGTWAPTGGGGDGGAGGGPGSGSGSGGGTATTGGTSAIAWFGAALLVVALGSWRLLLRIRRA